MFDKIKQAKQLWDAKRALQSEKVTVEKEGVRVVVNGLMNVEEVVLNAELDTERQARIVRDAVNDAMKQVQQIMAKKMQSIQGMM